MRCQSDICCVAAEQAMRYSDFNADFSDSQFVALLSRTSLSILLEWGFTPSNSPAGAVCRYQARRRSNSPSFLRAPHPGAATGTHLEET
jgi:hypothetical protein